MRFGWVLMAGMLVSAAAFAGEKEDLAATAWPILEKGTRSGDMLARARAVEALPRVPGRDALPYVKEALRDPQWVVRKAAIKVLAGRGDADGRSEVVAALKDPSLPLDEDAYELVSTLKPAEGRALLLAALLDPANPTRDRLMTATLSAGRDAVAAAFQAGLAKGDPWFVEKLAGIRIEDRLPLAEALAKDKDARVALAGLEFALKMDVKLPAAVLQGAFKSKDEALRNTAAELLARAGDKAAAKSLLPLGDGDDAARMRFLRAAAAAPSIDLLPRLKKYLIVKPAVEGKAPEINVDELTLAYQALAGIGDEDAKKRIETDLDSTYVERRIAATRAVGRLMGTRALPKLGGLLGDGNLKVRVNAADAIGDLGQAESVEILERALRDPERDMRVAVVKALGRIHDKAVINVARFLTYDNDPEVRKEAILAITRVNHESAWDDLRTNVEDPDHTIRFNVIRSMVYLDPVRAMEFFDRALSGLVADDLVAMAEQFKVGFLPHLKKALSSDRAWARQGALRAIALLPDAETPFLKEAAAVAGHADARRGALVRLRLRSCAEALDIAGRLSQDRDPDVRIAAVETLVQCGDGTAVEAVKLGLMDTEENVRVAAAEGLLAFPKTGAKKAPAPKGKK